MRTLGPGPGFRSIFSEAPTELTFTLSGEPASTLIITAATATDADFVWTGPGGSFTGKAPAVANFQAGSYTLRSTRWAAVTALTWTNKKITAIDINNALLEMIALTSLRLDANPLITVNVGGWTLPATLTTLYLFQSTAANGNNVTGDCNNLVFHPGMIDLQVDYTKVSGNLSGTLSATLTTLYLHYCTSLGTINGVTFPASFNAACTCWFNNSGASGDISGWTLPTNLKSLRFNNTSVSGNLAWTLPASLTELQGHNCSSLGTVSGITFPASFTAACTIALYTNVNSGGDISGWVLPTNLSKLEIGNSGVSGNLAWTLPASLTYLDIGANYSLGTISGITFPASFTAACDIYCINSSASGDVSGWVLPTNLRRLRIDNSQVSGDLAYTLPASMIQFQFNNDPNIGDISGITLPAAFTAACDISFYYCTNASGDISDWTLPANLKSLGIHYTKIETDFTWTLPASMTGLYVQNNSNVGDISNLTFPAGFTAAFSLDASNSSANGDVGGWGLPTNMRHVSLNDSLVTGDIGGWVLQANITVLNLHNTTLAGDISQWNLAHTTLQTFSLYNSDFTYGTGSAFSAIARTTSVDYKLNDCGMTTAEIDRILADCVASGNNPNKIYLTGNSAPTDGQNNADRLTLVGNGWTVTVDS